MQPNDDENYESPDESEYQFSDDDHVSYEDTDHHDEAAPTTTVPPVATPGGASRGKRIMAVGAVFVALVLVIYKFVSPTSVAVSTDITAQPAVAQNGPLQANVPAVTPPITDVAVSQPMPQTAAQLPPAGSPVADVATNNVGGMPLPGSPVPASAVASAQPSATSSMPLPAGGTATASLPAPTAPQGMVPPGGDQFASAQPSAPMQAAPAPAAMPDVMPLQSLSSMQNQADQAIAGIVATPQVPGSSDAQLVAVQQQSAQVAAQLQASYSQKINEFNNQNQALQSEVQTLNTRVAGLEADLNKMMQLLTQQTQTRTPAQAPASTAAPQQQGSANDLMGQTQAANVEPKSSYNVQAIIPGRAWLRADNGETVTVAEGDVVHDLGRITKIDPYDGIVEINTGSKVVSLSYGNVA